MKLVCAFLFFCILYFSAFSQSVENKFSPEELPRKIYTLKKQANGIPLNIPFSKIRVIDARHDSSKLGFIARRDVFKDYKKQFERLALKGGVAAALESYYESANNNSEGPNSYGLLIVLKKFWISSTKPYNFQKQSLSMTINGESRFIAKWELFIFKDDLYLPFRRIDTVIESTQSVRQLFKDEDATDYNKENIYSILNSLPAQFNYAKALDVFEQRPKKSLAEIMEANNERFKIPVIAAHTINRGVFLNFREFIANTPSIIDFKEKAKKYSLTRRDEYITDAKDSILTNYWAYATKKYTRIGPYGTESIFRCGNSYELFLKKRIAVPRGQGSIVIGDHYMLWIPYQVDMETGEFY